MKRIRLLALLTIGLLPTTLWAQNPVSYPKDTVLSPPELNFEVLWHTFEDNYAFFKLRHIDWHKTYQQYRPKVKATTSQDSLYNLFSGMVTPFYDDHINVIVPGVKQAKSRKPSSFDQQFKGDSLRRAFWQLVNQSLAQTGFGPLQSTGPVFRGKPLFQYTTSDKLAYLRFNRCFVDQEADSKADALVLHAILDTVFAQLSPAQAMIIDVRDNIGGNDEFGYEVAGRFITRKQVGMYKKTRKRRGGYEEFVNPETWFIEPKGKAPFRGKVIVLTNDQTASAGDVFAMIMKALPQVKLIGENTRGIYSDMYGFTLPNGWLVSLSNQRYYNAQRICYEGSGTPVDIVVKNSRQDLVRRKDPVLLRALQVLSTPK